MQSPQIVQRLTGAWMFRSEIDQAHPCWSILSQLRGVPLDYKRNDAVSEEDCGMGHLPANDRAVRLVPYAVLNDADIDAGQCRGANILDPR